MYSPQIDTFLRVVSAGSFHKAAEELLITVPAVIKQINLLEGRLGVKLFTRTHQGLALTEGGRSFYDDARFIVQYCQESVVRAKRAMNQAENVIRIGTSPMTPGELLLDLWPNLAQQFPDVRFQLIPFENTPQNARDILGSLGLDIDIVIGPFDQNFLTSRGCAAYELFQPHICCAMSLRHPLARKSFLTVQDLYGEELMLIQRGWNQGFDRLRDDLQRLHPQVHITDFDFFKLSVFNECENSNVIIADIEPWMRLHPLLKILPVMWDYTVPFGLFHAPTPTPIIRHFLDEVDAVFHGTEYLP